MPRPPYPTYEEIHQMLADPTVSGRLMAALDDPASLEELTDVVRATSSEVLSYGVRCLDCGEWETACRCEVAS